MPVQEGIPFPTKGEGRRLHGTKREFNFLKLLDDLFMVIGEAYLQQQRNKVTADGAITK